MVKVNKIAVWKVEDQYFESADAATRAIREAIVQEMVTEQTPAETEIAEWVAANWDVIEQKVKAALAGT